MFTIGYTVFNQASLMRQIVEGLEKVPEYPAIILFDNCTDGSLKVFNECSGNLRNCRVFVNHGYDLFETLANNFILNRCLTDCCMLLQDDMVITDNSIFLQAEKIYREVPNAGLIGFKDGYEMRILEQYENMISSPFSTAKYKQSELEPGQYEFRTFVNRGPLCVSKQVIEQVGLLDERFFPIFWDDNDYSLRCHKAGRHNIVAYGNVISEPSWGATRRGSKIPYRKIYLANRARFALKWDLPCPRQNSLDLLAAWWARCVMHTTRFAWNLVVNQQIEEVKRT